MEIKIKQSDLKKSGIYIIKNNINHLIYIGSSVELRYRLRKHNEGLRRGNHYNKRLQYFYNKYGDNDARLAQGWSLLQACVMRRARRYAEGAPRLSHNVWWLHDVAKSKRKHSIKQPTKQVQKQR
jgi:hypothetical protein